MLFSDIVDSLNCRSAEKMPERNFGCLNGRQFKSRFASQKVAFQCGTSLARLLQTGKKRLLNFQIYRLELQLIFCLFFYFFQTVEGRKLKLENPKPLHFSVYINRPRISEALLDGGANPNAPSGKHTVSFFSNSSGPPSITPHF
jgi:hypothetical protein